MNIPLDCPLVGLDRDLLILSRETKGHVSRTRPSKYSMKELHHEVDNFFPWPEESYHFYVPIRSNSFSDSGCLDDRIRTVFITQVPKL